MSSPPAQLLTVLADPRLSQSVDRSAAAAGLRISRPRTPSRKAWSAATAVVLDHDSAVRCGRLGLARRDGVVLVSASDPSPEVWATAVDIGAQHLCVLPAQEPDLVKVLSEASEAGRRATRAGRVIAVLGGRGGGGASVFAAALALCSREALLVDLDPCSGGLDMVVGAESAPGLRWPDLSLQSGRLNWTALRAVLPRGAGVAVLSCARSYCDIDVGAAAAVVDAGRRGGAVVVCDVPRQLNPAAAGVLEVADMVVLVTGCDVRGIAATSAIAEVIRAVTPDLGLVVRGPAPGGLRASEVADVVGAPLLAAMRPEPMLAQRLEHGGLKLGGRSPLGAAARAVLSVLDRRNEVHAA